MHRLCVTLTNLRQRKHNEFRACALLVPSVGLALVSRSSGVHIHTWKNAHIFEPAENVNRMRRWPNTKATLVQTSRPCLAVLFISLYSDSKHSLTHSMVTQ